MPSVFDFAHLWQQDELSDVGLVIHAPPPEGGDAAVVLQRLPAHGALLSVSPYFKAMMVRWQHKRPHEDSSSIPSKDPATSAATAAAVRCEVVLTLQNAEQLPAAMAVLAALYAVKPLPELLSELPQAQQLQAALLADMWQVPQVSAAAVQLLEAAASTSAGLTDAVVQLFLGLDAHPTFILPLLKCLPKSCFSASSRTKLSCKRTSAVRRVLLSVLGDLEAVWADALLQDTLLGLPLPAMELLLSYDELKVASEDTVLYTAGIYIERGSWRPEEVGIFADAAVAIYRQKLAALIRCPRLSQFWVTAAAFSGDAPKMLLAHLQPQMKQLFFAQQADPDTPVPHSYITSQIPSAPPSWLRPPRRHKQLDGGVQVTWTLSVADIKAAALQSASQQGKVSLKSSATPPLGGLTWYMQQDWVGMRKRRAATWECLLCQVSLLLTWCTAMPGTSSAAAAPLITSGGIRQALSCPKAPRAGATMTSLMSATCRGAGMMQRGAPRGCPWLGI